MLSKKFSGSISEPFPDFLMEEAGIISKSDAIKQIHFPKSQEELEKAFT